MYSILLAAGLSKRMGKQKLLLPFGGSTVIETVIDNMAKAGLTPICAVFSEEVDRAVTSRPDFLTSRINPAPERGQSSSLAIGLDMIPKGEDFCIMLGDLPLATPEGMASLLERFKAREKGCTALAPARNGVPGHPFFYEAVWRERFRDAEGDMGGREVLKRWINELAKVESGEGHFKDIDTPQDYKEIASKD